MPNTYYYACDECQQYVTAADKTENITCRYCSKPLTYQGFTDESLRYYQYIREWNYHCFAYYGTPYMIFEVIAALKFSNSLSVQQ